MRRGSNWLDIDYEKLLKTIHEKGESQKGVSVKIGRSDSYIKNNHKKNSAMMPSVENLICDVLGVPHYTFVKQTKSITLDTSDTDNTDNEAILNNLEQIRIAIEKLGNISMQNMEYLKTISDYLK